MTLLRYLCLVPIAVAAVAASYGFAKIGHPGAVWFWRDILGVLQ